VPADPGSVVVPDLPVLATPAVFPGPPVGEPLGVFVGDEVADEDGVGSAEGDGFREVDGVVFGLAVLAVPAVLAVLEQLVGVAVLVVLVLAEADEALAVVPVVVAVELGLALLLGGVCGVVMLGLTLGLPVSAGGVVAGLVVGDVVGALDWLDWLGWADLRAFGVPAAVGVDEWHEAAGVGLRGVGRLLVMPTPPPLGWPGADLGVLAEELVVPDPVTVAVRLPITWRNGGTANASAMMNVAQAMPRRGRSSPSRQSLFRPRLPDEAPERAWTNEAKDRLPVRAGADLTRARMRSRPSGRGSIWSATACSSRRRNSAKSRPGSPSWPGRVITPSPGPRATRPSRGRCGS
jgi:hypothetical protein